ncbi:mechanosensitive ion channel family protein [Mangrovibacillus cuniculi]|uniref:Mechanosensitive ion channel family protein n=1 Tax=Mangrovibacillus cuniculi TaxID=2593652 RepID=A0A7S8CDD8_9BACI|nr:mechanosensitive ion channel family protein [Mangrovibacillus cuniculi]QPC47919.1 mechanosensitive ion channel family protein [Mangrovibacillus cuniculi]
MDKNLKEVEGALNESAEKLLDKEMWLNIGEITLQIIVILLLTMIAQRIVKSMLSNVFKVRSRTPLNFSQRRETTLQKLLENVATYVIYFVSLVTILGTFNINVQGLIAGAGIVGLAVGFGAQNLVRDIISGFFIIFEDQFSVGDYVRIGQAEGFVEEIGLRTTKVKSWTGELHIFPNGSIVEVVNFSIHNSIAVVDISIAYEGDIAKAESVIQEWLQTVPEKYVDVVKTPELLGVQTLGASEVVLRLIAETLPMKHLSVARGLRKDLKVVLDQHGIEIPFPRLVMYSREEEKQNVPATE